MGLHYKFEIILELKFQFVTEFWGRSFWLLDHGPSPKVPGNVNHKKMFSRIQDTVMT